MFGFKTEWETWYMIVINSHPVMKSEDLQGSKGWRKEFITPATIVAPTGSIQNAGAGSCHDKNLVKE